MSPLELSLRNSSLKVEPSSKRIKLLNSAALLLLFFLLFFYAFIANGLVGADYQSKNLYKKLEVLKEDVRTLEAEATALRLPSLIRQEVEEKMVEGGNVTYLKSGQEELVIIN